MTRQAENILKSVSEEEPRLFLTDSSARSAVLNRVRCAADLDDKCAGCMFHHPSNPIRHCSYTFNTIDKDGRCQQYKENERERIYRDMKLSMM